MGYAYNAAGKLTQLTYPSGRRVVLTYTGGQISQLGLAKDATSTPQVLLSQIQWEPFGAARSWRWQLGTTTQLHTWTRDTYGRLVRYRLGTLLRGERPAIPS